MKTKQFASDLAAALARLHPAIRAIVLTPRPREHRPVVRKPVKPR